MTRRRQIRAARRFAARTPWEQYEHECHAHEDDDLGEGDPDEYDGDAEPDDDGSSACDRYEAQLDAQASQ